MTDAIVAEDVRRVYGDTVALDGVSLTVAEGAVYGLIGPNGAGKTTLVRALTGTTDAEGRVSVFGTAPREVDPERIGLLPQEFSPAERLTARELVDYYGGLYDHARETDAVLADVGLVDDDDTWYENLSGGQKRRTCVATALVNDPDLLLLDEPTTGIDPTGRRSLWALVERLASEGTTVLLTTHYMAEAEHLCDRVGLLADGRLVAEGTPAELVAEYGGDSFLDVESSDPTATAALEDAGYRLAPERDLAVEGIEAREVSAVAETLDAAGVEYGALAWRQPDLEDVYLSLTGRAVGAGGTAVERGGDEVEERAVADGGAR
ncbi:ABC transporter ATP-binding protein [Salinirubellus salinus]|uniref:ABC transporter ATP-binding protein n=1 Tax=Salinirubellus salinus TaxID=1364945 RepID=A0A9E7UBU5_9EURY|nr:ABC transporter ATP-binding protein [Salinirubellus salinus]UWM55054.1 ABC transporter ATP-binding protein [Salinirubellus salinus]